MENAPDFNEIFSKFLQCENALISKRNICKLYRDLIVIMLEKGITKQGIVNFFTANGHNIKYQTFATYLRRNPITDADNKRAWSRYYKAKQHC